MIVLGIDPALTSLGWAIVIKESTKFKYIASGIIKTTSKELIHKRLALISNSIEKIILDYKPNITALEETFVNKNNVSSLKLGYVCGAIMALIGKYNMQLYELKPNSVKKTITGYGHAEKNQILHMIKLLLHGTSLITSSDEAGAVAIAYSCLVYGSRSIDLK